MSPNLQEEYARILEESRQRGEVMADQAGQERRSYPRLEVKAADLWISSVPEYSMVDMSVSGVALMSNYPLQPGEMLTITLGTVLSIEAEVVNCQLMESPTDHSDAVFRIQCKFAQEVQGMELLVEVKKREHLN